jgi:hypothetical protein
VCKKPLLIRKEKTAIDVNFFYNTFKKSTKLVCQCILDVQNRLLVRAGSSFHFAHQQTNNLCDAAARISFPSLAFGKIRRI